MTPAAAQAQVDAQTRRKADAGAELDRLTATALNTSPRREPVTRSCSTRALRQPPSSHPRRLSLSSRGGVPLAGAASIAGRGHGPADPPTKLTQLTHH